MIYFCNLQDDLLKILGERHQLYDFLSTLSLKCSYLLFNKEHVKEILLEATVQKSTGNTLYIQSCMNILVVIICISMKLVFLGVSKSACACVWSFRLLVSVFSYAPVYNIIKSLQC